MAAVEARMPTFSSAGLESELIGKPLALIEKWAIEETLKMTGGNREEAAKVLDIGARTLYRRLDQYKKESDGNQRFRLVPRRWDRVRGPLVDWFSSWKRHLIKMWFAGNPLLVDSRQRS